MGVRLVSKPEPVVDDQAGEFAPQQRIDAESGKCVWRVQVVDLALVSQLETSVSVEILADAPPVLPGTWREVEFVGLTVEPVQGTGPAGPWTDWVYRALGVTAAPRTVEDTKPLPMWLIFGDDVGSRPAGSDVEAS
ncbi:hypothetical protein AB0L13_38815 [Saccharopolyspora shandongensis]|uniref:hypothetical protein n=1 Tax=Saccharopolyspora shandongensis TaxID=418495 RepID=UPI003416B37D